MRSQQVRSFLGGLATAGLLALAWCAARDAPAAEPQLRSSHVGPDLVPPGLLGGSELDLVQRGAIYDSWVLHHHATYEYRQDLGIEKRVPGAIRLAQQQRAAGQVEVAVDDDQDGNADLWVYFSGDQPAVVEADRFGTGCRDLRIDMRESPWSYELFRGWSVEPPFALPTGDGSKIALSDIYDLAVAADRPDRSHPALSQLALKLMPDLQSQLTALVLQTGDEQIARELAAHVERATELLPQFTEIHRQENMGSSLRIYKGLKVTTRPFDLDDEEGEEVAVAFAPWGVDTILFYEKDWMAGSDGSNRPKETEGLIAEVHFHKSRATRVDLRGRQYLAIAGVWVRPDPAARRRVAQGFLLPGFQVFREGDSYQALSRWRTAARIAVLLGDYRQDKYGDPVSQMAHASRSAWKFEVEGWSAGQLLEIAKTIGFRSEAPSFAGLAETCVARRQYPEALELYELQLRFSKKLFKAVTQRNALDEMSSIYRQIGSYDRAIECLFESLDLESTLAYSMGVMENVRTLAQDVGDQDVLVRTMKIRTTSMIVNRCCKLATIAALYADLGELDTAKSHLAEAERMNKDLGHAYLEADLLNLRAKVDLAEGQWDLAVRRLQRALALVQAEIARQAVSENSGDLFREGRAAHVFSITEPRELHRVAICSNTHPLAYQALTADMLAEAYLQRITGDRARSPEDRGEDLARARQWQERSLQWHRQTEDQEGILVGQARLAMIAMLEGDLDQASLLAATVVTDSRTRAMFETLWRGLALQGAICRLNNELPQAVAAYEEAVAEIESVRARIYSEPVRRGFLGSKMDVYEQLALLYLEDRGEDDREANIKIWQCMERAKARTLLDMIGGQSLGIKGREVAQAKAEVPLLFRSLPTTGAGGLGPNTGDTADAYRETVRTLADRPQLQEVASLSSVNPAGFQAVAGVLGPGDLLLEYQVTRSGLLVAVISADEIRVLRLADYDRARLRGDITAYRRALEDPTSNYEPLARRLGEQLLMPCLKGHQKVRHLCIIPGGALHYLPFGTLVLSDGKFLVEHVRVSYAPSASALVYALHREPAESDEGANQTLIVADPRPRANFSALPFAALEGKQLLELAREPKIIFVDHTATESRIVRELPGTRFFHFAGHTYLPSNAPMRAALMCTEDLDRDGRLQVREIFGLNLSGCEMAVLSACETRLGRWSRGDEIVGLERAFVRAGVPTVVASLWKVDDAATQALMVEFYRNLWSRNQGKLEALHKAQLAMIRGDLQPQLAAANRALDFHAPQPLPAGGAVTASTRHPRYWASFVLSGDWR